jgi:predicted RNA-binding protein with PUA-like domain
VYGIDQMEKDGATFWNGVRNYAARNFMQAMKPGDLVFFYHSNAEPSAIVGIVEVAAGATPDPTQFDEKGGEDMGYDPKAKPDAPIWYGVRVRFRERLARPVTLQDVKAAPALAEMKLLKVSRLSVSPVTGKEWKAVLAIAKKPRK